MLSLREYRNKADRLADFLPWAALVAPGVVRYSGPVAGLGRGEADAEEHHALGHRLDEVEHVVHAADQLVDVVAVERRDPVLAQPLHRLVREGVAGVLGGLDLVREALQLVVDPDGGCAVAGGGAVGAGAVAGRAEAAEPLEHLDEQLRRLDALCGVLGEGIKKCRVLLCAEHGRNVPFARP